MQKPWQRGTEEKQQTPSPGCFHEQGRCSTDLIESSRAASDRQNTAVTQSAGLSRHNCPRAQGDGPAPWGGGGHPAQHGDAAPWAPRLWSKGDPRAPEALGRAPSPGCPGSSWVCRGPEELGVLRALGRWVLWRKTSASAASIAIVSWCTVLHKARAGLKKGCEAKDAQAAWSRVSGCLRAPQGWLCPLHGGSGLLHPARACGAHSQAGARGRSGW